MLPVTTMSTVELWRYIAPPRPSNEQAAQLQKIQFWKRALYPFACLVMVGAGPALRLPHARSGGVSLKVFVGIMLGVSFVLLNNVFRPPRPARQLDAVDRRRGAGRALPACSRWPPSSGWCDTAERPCAPA